MSNRGVARSAKFSKFSRKATNHHLLTELLDVQNYTISYYPARLLASDTDGWGQGYVHASSFVPKVIMTAMRQENEQYLASVRNDNSAAD